MLFLLQILGLVIKSGIIQYAFKKYQQKGIREDFSKFTKYYSDKRIGKYKYGDYGRFRKFWDKLPPQAKTLIRKRMFEVLKQGKKTSIIQQYNKYMNQVERTMKKVELNKNITKEEREAFKIFEDLHLGESGNGKGYTNISSSWILSIKYTRSTKRMWVNKIRGTCIYKYPNVPSYAVIALLIANKKGESVGKKWWRDWYWKYSVNAHRWARLK